MIKAFSTGVFLLLLISVDLSFAQAVSGGSKIYSGYFHDLKSKASFWDTFFGKKSHKQEEVIRNRQCSIEFRSPVPFSQSVAVMPEKLSYFIRFKNDPPSSEARDVAEKGAFERFIIRIYTDNDDDDQQYSIDPNAETKQVGINGEHHISDTYLIYLILGSGINHLEIVGSSGDEKGKYILDKLEVHDNR